VATFSQTIGFLGAGRMATALARGCIQSGLVVAKQLLAADPSEEARQRFVEQVPGSRTTSNNAQVLDGADVVVLAVKPQQMSSVLTDIAGQVDARHLLVSIAAGITLAKLAEGLPPGSRLVRVMPNTPCLVGLGACCYSRSASAGEDDGQLVRQLLESVGRAYEVEENRLDAVTGLSGSGPAFVYRIIEALAEGGSSMGLSNELAVELAALTARGAAEMVLTTGCSPAELRDQVTSPGGTTLAGLDALEKLGGADALCAAVKAATKRSVELGQS